MDNSIWFFIKTIWTLEFLDINFAKWNKLKFNFFFSPAGYKGQIKTKSDLEKTKTTLETDIFNLNQNINSNAVSHTNTISNLEKQLITATSKITNLEKDIIVKQSREDSLNEQIVT